MQHKLRLQASIIILTDGEKQAVIMCVFFSWSSAGGTMTLETLVPFATASEDVAIVESRTSGGTMA